MASSPCIPPRLPIVDLDWQTLLPPVGKAHGELTRYDAILEFLPHAAVLLSPLITHEATLSSRIEGTQATLEEVLGQDAGIEQPPERRDDIYEIINYRAALRVAEQEMRDRSLSLSLVKTIHQRLMEGVRGQDKTPGKFRETQNWIGQPGCSLEDARFVPPEPMQLLPALQAWENYLGLKDEDPILQAAVAHAQFEILHPFLDGNGRIGRILIPLLLFQRKVISRPIFYLSEYLEAHRDRYYDGLLGITERGNWQGWLKFFTEAVTAQAKENHRKAKAILELYETMKPQVIEITHSQFAISALDAFFEFPFFGSKQFAEKAAIGNRSTSNRLLKQLLNAGLVQVIRKRRGRAPAVYIFPKLLNIVEDRDIF